MVDIISGTRVCARVSVVKDIPEHLFEGGGYERLFKLTCLMSC